jgi:hypothetical protein
MTSLISFKELLRLTRVYLNFPTTAGLLLLLDLVRQYGAGLDPFDRRQPNTRRLLEFIERHNDSSVAGRGFKVYVEVERAIQYRRRGLPSGLHRNTPRFISRPGETPAV